MAKKIRTENLKSDSGSKFLEYAGSFNHFAISLQKRSVFYEKLYFESLVNFKKLFFYDKSKSLFFLEPEMVINTAKKIRTEILNPVLGSFFLEYSHSDDHFAISLQKRSVFDEKLHF